MKWTWIGTDWFRFVQLGERRLAVDWCRMGIGLADWSKVWFGTTEWSGIGNALAEKTMIDRGLY